MKLTDTMKSKDSVFKLALARYEDGFPSGQIARLLRVSQRTIQRWVKKGKIECPGKSPRIRSRSLTLEQEEAVLEFIENNAGVFLDEIVDFVFETFDVCISTSTVSRLLRRNDFSRKRGTRVNIKLQQTAGMRFLEDIRPIYDASPLTFASLDEMSVMLNLAPTHGYARRGVRAIIPQPSKRTVSWMLTLCISAAGFVFWDMRDSTINAEVFSEFLRRLPDGLTLILDNASVHHANKCLWAKGLQSVAEVAEGESIQLKFIPSYAPHLNPVEHTFNLVRNLLRRKKAWTEVELRQGLTEMFQTNAFSPSSVQKLIRSVLLGGPNPGQRLRS